MKIDKQQEAIVVALNKSKLSATSKSVIDKLNTVLGLQSNDFAEIVDSVVHFDIDKVKPTIKLIDDTRVSMSELSAEPNAIIILGSWLS